MFYAEDKCLAEVTPILRIEECIDNLAFDDINGVNCTSYREDLSLCGENDTEDFKSFDMCCACDGGSKGYANMTTE